MEALQSTWGKCARADRSRPFPSPPRSKTHWATKTHRRRTMSQAEQHHKINYIEFAATEIPRARQFYAAAFGWSFEDWGPDYIGFDVSSAAMAGGFRKSNAGETSGSAAPLVVLYSRDLAATEK